MKNFQDIAIRYQKGFLRTLLVLASLALILALLPHRGKFNYEYQVGKPWLHQNLIAPFDFAILKTENELQRERDSLLKDISPYFDYDSAVVETEIKLLENDLANIKTKWQKSSSRKIADSTFRKLILTPLKNVYSRGVLSGYSYPDFELSPDQEIVILNNNVARETEVSDVYTLKQAYNFINKELQTKLSGIEPDSNINLSSFFEIEKYLEPNLFYNRSTTENIRKEELSSISTTKGMVQAGELIISKGVIVTPEKFKIIESLRSAHVLKMGRSNDYFFILLGYAIVIASCLIALILFLHYFRKDIFDDLVKTSFVFIVLNIVVISASAISRIDNISVFIFPVIILPVVIRIFFDSRLGLFSHIVSLLLIGFVVPNGFEYVMIGMLAGIVAVFSLKFLHRRGQLVRTAFLVFITQSIVYFGMALLYRGDINDIDLLTFAWFAGNSVLILFAYPLIYIFEKLFGFISDVTLIELSDTNHPLLRKLAEKAPGTFQHSLQVANLTQEAVQKIGGNPLLARTGALYHDIGKSENSIYFTENQTEGFNPHSKLNYTESAKIITNHLTKGVRMARKHNLPSQIIEFITTHHGTGKAQYFYMKQKQDHPDEPISDEDFEYPGFKPHTVETAALMMADSVEAASKSLKEYSKENIANLVNSIIDKQLKEGQFEEAPINFRDIKTIKALFIAKLVNFYHSRIEYPKDKQEKKEEKT